MGSFNDLPTDVLWLVLRDTLVNDFTGGKPYVLTQEQWESPIFDTSRKEGYLASYIIPLSRVNKRIRRLLKDKCQWITGSNRQYFGFKVGSLRGLSPLTPITE